MNIFHRMGDWWDARRKTSRPELVKLMARVEALEKGPQFVRELSVVKTEVEQIKLFVGLKRQQASAATGAKIA